MSKISDAIKKILLKFLNEAITEAKSFFSLPNAMLAIKIAAFAILNPLISQLKSLLEQKISQLINKTNDNLLNSIVNTSNITDDDVKDYVKNNRTLQKIIKYSDNTLSESLLSDIIVACDNPTYYEVQSDQLNGYLKNANINADANDFLRIIKNESDFDTKTNSFKIDRGLQ